jgi:hypothetical protein
MRIGCILDINIINIVGNHPGSVLHDHGRSKEKSMKHHYGWIPLPPQILDFCCLSFWLRVSSDVSGLLACSIVHYLLGASLTHRTMKNRFLPLFGVFLVGFLAVSERLWLDGAVECLEMGRELSMRCLRPQLMNPASA